MKAGSVILALVVGVVVLFVLDLAIDFVPQFQRVLTPLAQLAIAGGAVLICLLWANALARPTGGGRR